jgi:hypothetical protein
MSGLLGLVILVLDIFAILDVLKQAWSGGKKALWVVLIIIFPLIGLILYYLLGKKKTA